jgi:hypothetical protein
LCTYWISPSRHGRVTKGNCGCDMRRKRLPKDRFPIFDIPLFCRVFPEGVVGDCGFSHDGFCFVFEDGCARWNELGDKLDYSVGKMSPFRSGGGRRGLEK